MAQDNMTVDIKYDSLQIEPAEPVRCGEVLSSFRNSTFWFLCSFCGKQIAIDSLDFLDHIMEEIGKLETKADPNADFSELVKFENEVTMDENGIERIQLLKIEPKFYFDESLENNIEFDADFIKVDLEDTSVACMENSKRFSCKICDKTFESTIILLKHHRTHSDDINVSNKNQLISFPKECEICKINFKSLEEYYFHKRKICEPDRKTFNKLNSAKMMKIIIKNTDTIKSKWTCKICNKTLQSKFAFEMHQNTHTGDRPYKCDECPGAYRHATTLSNHKKQHHSNQNLMNKCENCSKMFKTLRRFKSHNCSNESATGPGDNYGNYECDICLEVFDKDYQLRHHKNNTHSGSLVCDVCGKEFKTKKYFIAHKEDVHSDKTYNCDKCDQIFKKRSLLKDHIMRDHIKRYQCSYCMKTFLSSTQVRAHETIHTGTNKLFQCEECGKSFPRNFQLRLHKKYHAQLKEYECDICLKRFNTDRALNSHTPYHTNERNFMCPICSKAFKTAKCLVKHKKIHLK